MNFAAYFEKATKQRPYSWQERLAGDPGCRSLLIDIPIGLGKTAGALMAWLWNRSKISNEQSPLHGRAALLPWHLAKLI